MNLYEKIIQIYGDYIAKWEHPTFAKPTEEQLA